MKNIKISIIIPVYDVADYLSRCIDSCVNQTLQEIEIIVVNDCSPDSRDGEIMREYEKQYPNKVRCIWHKKNLMLGAARNTGIRVACGEYIYCLDSDDYIDLELCEKMHNAIIAESADMAVCDCNRVGVANEILFNWKYERSNGNFDTSDLNERIKNIGMHNAWLIMIKKSIIENNNLYFPEYIGFEDSVCVLWYLASPKIVRVHEALYYYAIRNNSIIREKKYLAAVSAIKSAKDVLESAYFNNLYATVKKNLFLYYAKYILIWCRNVCMNYPTEFTKYCNNVLDLFKIYKVDYNDDIYMQSEEDICHREIFSFIEQNINMTDFNIEFIAYYEYQHTKMLLKKMHKLFPIYKNKRLTLWGAGIFGKRNAKSMNMLGIKFEITDINAKIHGEKIVENIIVKPWDELKEHTDVVLVSVMGGFEKVYERLSKECPDIEVVDLIGLL